MQAKGLYSCLKFFFFGLLRTILKDFAFQELLMLPFRRTQGFDTLGGYTGNRVPKCQVFKATNNNVIKATL